MLYVIKLGFEMLNAIFFDMFDKNALIVMRTHSHIIASFSFFSFYYYFIIYEQDCIVLIIAF